MADDVSGEGFRVHFSPEKLQEIEEARKRMRSRLFDCRRNPRIGCDCAERDVYCVDKESYGDSARRGGNSD
jgi:hypothetical protein